MKILRGGSEIFYTPEAGALCKTAKTADVATTDTSIRFTSLLTKLEETITTGTRN